MVERTDYFAFLRQVPIFREVPDDVLAEITATAAPVQFATGERLITQDGLSDYLFIIVQGQAQVEIEEVSEIAVRGPRSMVGELAMIFQTPRTANVTALTDVTALRFDSATFRHYLATVPSLTLGMLQEVSYHLDQAMNILYRLARRNRELEKALMEKKRL
jgi:CRP-like cAMP-binding protein